VSKKIKGKTPLSIILLVLLAIIFAFIGCSQPTDSEIADPGVTDTETNPTGPKGSISGKVACANPASSGTIKLYLEKTDGFHAETINTSVAASTSARFLWPWLLICTAGPDGSYTFEGVVGGIYTLYAASEDEQEQAVLINIPVEEDETVTNDPLALKPVGSIKGKIVLDSTDTGNLGFTLFIEGNLM
jgi:hypothetical protein